MTASLFVPGCREVRDGLGLVHTYSIVAYDVEREEMGLGVQSHFFAVGAVVPWAEPGVGVIATQASVDASYGPLGLAMMRAGRSAGQALQSLLASDPGANARQVAMVDARGDVAVHTGEKCMEAAGHLRGTRYAAQANLMLRDTVWRAMGEAFERGNGDLAERLLIALEAAESEGGDVRGMQSAALLIVSRKPPNRPGEGLFMDLRVDDSSMPLKELRRLMMLSKAASHWHGATQALHEQRLSDEQIEAALEAFDKALSLLDAKGDIAEVGFWKAVTLVVAGRMEEARRGFRAVFREEPHWRNLMPRLVQAGVLPYEEGLLDEIVSLD